MITCYNKWAVFGSATRVEARIMYSNRVHHMVEEWTTCMRSLSWRRHQGTVLKNCLLILPVSDLAKQAAKIVKHHVLDERMDCDCLTGGDTRGWCLRIALCSVINLLIDTSLIWLILISLVLLNISSIFFFTFRALLTITQKGISK